jgi:4-hydroxybenzoate polyprenyltransferase
MVDRPDDLKIGIRTSAITFGRFDVAAVMLCYALTLGLLALVGGMLGLGWAFHAALVLALSIIIQHYLWIRARDRQQCFRAFLHNNYIGMVIFAGIVLDGLL